MSDTILDSSVVAKWFLPEADSARAHQLITDAASKGDRLIVLDLVFPEVANAIWKRQRQRLITLDEANGFLNALARSPVTVEPAARLLQAAFDIAVRYDRAVYDALFVALARETGGRGITADEPYSTRFMGNFRKFCSCGQCEQRAARTQFWELALA